MPQNQTSTSEAANLAAAFINNTRRHVFLTGKAGTGKTTFLRKLIKQTHKNALIAAPTGIAAINAGGVTLHSLFQLPFGGFVPEEISLNELGNSNIHTPSMLARHQQMNASKRKLLQELELLVIDEVSMLRADLLDAIDFMLRSVRRHHSTAPFGGIQVLFIGDLLQLPPVVKEEEWRVLRKYYKTPYFFDAHCLQGTQPLYIELDKIYRQADYTFIGILNNLRDNRLEEEDIEILNSHYKPDFQPGPEENYIFLTTHNAKADAINKERLERLSSPSFFYFADIEGEFSEYSYPADFKMELKVGAQVMFTKNDLSEERRYFNGKIGKITRLSEESIEVELDDYPAPIIVEKYEWRNLRYKLNESTNEIEEEQVGSFRQYPLRLAWAITIHKSQGLTFEYAIVDIGQAFAPGQAYVALSRLTSLDGLVLASPIRRLPGQDEALAGFKEKRMDEGELQEVLGEESRAYLEGFVLQTFDFEPLIRSLQLHIASYTKDEQRSVKQKFLPWAQGLLKKLTEAAAVANKFRHQVRQMSQGSLEQLYSRVSSAQGYFGPIFKEMSTAILQQIDDLRSVRGAKTYTTELREQERLIYRQLQQFKKAVSLLKSALEGTEFSKEDITGPEERRMREQAMAELTRSRRSRAEHPDKEEATAKVDTFQETLRLYRDGHSIEEISIIRSLNATTIEGHLARFVAMGELNVLDFLPEEKLNTIVKAARDLNTQQMRPLKDQLGDDYSYSEIRLALAHLARG